MSQVSRTKDEAYLVELYNRAKESGCLETVFDVADIGQRIGISPKGVKSIMNILARANFIKKHGRNGADGISITHHGVRLAQELR